MSFGSPTPIEVAVQGVSLQDDYAYAQKVQAQMAKLDFLRDLQFAQENELSRRSTSTSIATAPASSA